MDDGCIEKFRILANQKYTYSEIKDKGKKVVFHIKIEIEQGPITLKFYTNGTLHLSASPKLDLAIFDSIVKSVEGIAEQCTESIHDKRPVSAIRAREVLEFVSELDTAKSNERMVAVILCDTANEVILTEIMKDKRISGSALREGVLKKISYLEGKNVVVPFSKELSNIREVRNKAVHDGQIPSEGQVSAALKTTKQFIETM